MKLHQVAQYADDLTRATAFYSDVLGCELIASFDPPGLVFFRLGGTRLLLDPAAPRALIYLRVDDVRETTDTLRAEGVTIDEGNLVGLASQNAPS